jgi:hypothetical protein
MERCHARKSKIHSNIFELKSSVFFTSFEVGSSMFSVRCSDCLHLIIRHSNVRLLDILQELCAFVTFLQELRLLAA